MKKFVIALLMLATGAVMAQDTVLPFIDTNIFLFNPIPKKSNNKEVKLRYFPLEEDIENRAPERALIFPGVYPATPIFDGFLMQSYTPKEPVDVVGIAVTMKEYHFYGKDKKLYRGFKDPEGVECLRYRVLLADTALDSADNMFDMFSIIADSIYYDDSTVLKKHSWFKYIEPTNDFESMIDWWKFTSDSVAPCVEFYFNQPVGTYRMDKTFYVGTKQSAPSTNQAVPCGGYTNPPEFESYAPLPKLYQNTPGDFFCTFLTHPTDSTVFPDSTARGYQFLWNNHCTDKSNVFYKKGWDYGNPAGCVKNISSNCSSEKYLSL